ncbi:MAG: GTPase HflX, partial [Terriglobales bacterium]
HGGLKIHVSERRPASRTFPPGARPLRETGSPRERAFLAGIEFGARRRPGSVAQMARRAAASFPEPEIQTPTAVSLEESLGELRELAASAGAEVVGEFAQRRDKPDPATLFGRGKLVEIAGAAASAGARLIIIDHELSPSQQRNIEHVVAARVLDRTQLILYIFARHARSREGQLQVELAQLEYLLPRLTGRGVEMSQLGGGIGTRGPGETQLETDRRKIHRRIRHIQEQLEKVRRHRAQQRHRRETVPVSTVALVGYTNAGKSTLFNALTRAGVLTSPALFATLDPTLRAASLPSRRKVLLSDTVGFIRNLPHTLVTSFRATLEEVQRAALLLHVIDSTSAISTAQEEQVEKVLGELGASARPRLRVVNKIDLLPPSEREALCDDASTVHISAARGIGLGTLLERIDLALEQDPLSRVRLRVPQGEGKMLALLEARARVFSRHYQDGFVELDAQAPESLLRKLRSYLVS